MYRKGGTESCSGGAELNCLSLKKAHMLGLIFNAILNIFLGLSSHLLQLSSLIPSLILGLFSHNLGCFLITSARVTIDQVV